MRSTTLKAALAAIIVAVPLSAAFAGQSGGGDGGRGSGAYEDFGQKRWFDGIDSFHQYKTPLGMPHYGSSYEGRAPARQQGNSIFNFLR